MCANVVLRNTLTAVIHIAKIVLRLRIAFGCCKSRPFNPAFKIIRLMISNGIFDLLFLGVLLLPVELVVLEFANVLSAIG